MLELIDKALKYAAIHHNGQTRKDIQHTPYVYHPAMTGFYLQHYGMDEELVAAAILHDTVEDTEATLEEIHKLFGEHVHDLVKCSTEDKTKSWEERKQAQLAGIRRGSWEAFGFPTKGTLRVPESSPADVLFVKLADKLHNISCTLEEIQAGTHSFDRMNRGRDKQEWYYRGLVKAFETRSETTEHPMFTEFKEKVAKVFDDHVQEMTVKGFIVTWKDSLHEVFYLTCPVCNKVMEEDAIAFEDYHTVFDCPEEDDRLTGYMWCFGDCKCVYIIDAFTKPCKIDFEELPENLCEKVRGSPHYNDNECEFYSVNYAKVKKFVNSDLLTLKCGRKLSSMYGYCQIPSLQRLYTLISS